MKHTNCLEVNELHALIEQDAELAITTLQKLEDQLTQSYWNIHTQVAKTSFGGNANQFNTLDSIGQLAQAINALQQTKGKFQGI